MDIKLPFQFILSIAAPPTGVIVTAAGIASLLSPVRAVVGVIAALPIKVILACSVATLGLPLGVTCLGTKATARSVGLFNTKLIATLRTFQRNARLQIGALASDFWPGNTLSDTGNIFTKTPLRTKAGFATFLGGDFLAALFTKHWRQFNYAKITLGIDGSATFARTILARPTTMIPKLLAALRTGCPDVSGLAIASARAVYLDATRPLVSGGVI